MAMTQLSPASSTLKLNPATRLGHVHLTVNNLEREIAFYTQVLGFILHEREGNEAALGTQSTVLLRLTEDPAAQRLQHTAGMYHFAILYPSKKELARAMARVFAMRYPNAPTDHGVSMTTYLDDLEGNNIELYVRTLDRATFELKDGNISVRYADGRAGSGRDPLDVEALFAELNEDDRLDVPLPEGTVLGHVHLYVKDLDETMRFYHEVLGFSEGPLFSAFRMGEVGLDEAQPHVIAFNTWKGPDIPPAPEGVLGIRYYTVVLRDTEEQTEVVARIKAAGIEMVETGQGVEVRDPSGIRVVIALDS